MTADLIPTGHSGEWKWRGNGASVGDETFFAPFSHDDILSLHISPDTGRGAVRTISTGRTGESKWADAAVLGATVFFTPFYSDDVLVLDSCAGDVSFVPTGTAGLTR
eukprot:gene58104-biopygen105462